MRENPREAQCDGKVAFLTYEQAQRAMKRKHKHKNIRGRDIYRCHICRHFHIGGRAL